MVIEAALVPLASVLLGAVITYWLAVRTRRRTKAEDAIHDAMAAVSVAMASQHYMRTVALWEGATSAQYDAVLSQLGVQGQLQHAQAVASARAALARASAYAPELDLTRYWRGTDIAAVVKQGAEIVALLQRALDKRRSSAG